MGVSILTSYALGKFTKCIIISSYTMEFHNFCMWYNRFRNNGVDRELSIMPDTNEFLMYEKTPFLISCIREQGTTQLKIKIQMFGTNKSILDKLYSEFKTKSSDEVSVYTPDKHGSGWRYVCPSPKRELDSVILNQEIMDDIVSRIDEWKISKEWYHERGLSYKLGLVFHGPPGTGKTSFIKSLASYLGYDLYILDLTNQTDSTLMSNISQTSKRSIIVMEDFDSISSLNARNETLGDTETKKDQADAGVTLSGLLNSLDGIIPLDDRIVIMTTNVLTGVDDAVIRKGRIDGVYYFGLLTDKEIKKYIAKRFPSYEPDPSVIFEDIAGCDLQDVYFQNKRNLIGLLKSLKVK